MSAPAAREGKRSFVFLQGPTSVAFRDLGRTLAARGHDVIKVNFCPGDWIFWHGDDAVTYRGRPASWPDFLRELLVSRGATDIVYFADRFPYHKAAQRVARELGVRAVSMEYGYLRPDWLILEQGGQSTYSHFPNDPALISQVAQDLEPADRELRYPISLVEEAVYETVFHVSNALLGFLTPNYRPGRYYPVLIEFPAYVPRLIRRELNAPKADRKIASLAETPAPRFLVPLQMQNDYQLRDNAPKGYQVGFVREVMKSFRDHAPQEAELVFKLHPMDNGLERWNRRVTRLAREFGLEARVHFVDGGTLGDIFDVVDGVVVINSTTGLTALRSGLPVKPLGVAVYDIEGLTHQGDLDGFWTAPTAPDPKFMASFVRCMAAAIHVRGTVYGRDGRAALAKNGADKLERELINGHGMFVERPPRLDKARALKIAVDWPLGKGDG